jgi:plasmid stabilization system protein ParE
VKRIRFTAAAKQEFLSAIGWYDAASPGPGGRFVAAVEAAAVRAAAFPSGGSPAGAGTRRIVLGGFPFSLFYKQEGDGIVVHALAHHARRPTPWHRGTSE